MKLSILLLFALTVILHAQCPSGYGRAGSPFPLIVRLEPGQQQQVFWDWRPCDYGVHNWTVYVTQPASRSGNYRDIPRNAPLTVTAIDTVSGAPPDFEEPYRKYFASVDCSVIVLTIALAPAARKAIDVQVQYSAVLGETKHCP